MNVAVIFITLKDGSAENYSIRKFSYENDTIRVETTNGCVIHFEMSDIKEFELLEPHKED